MTPKYGGFFTNFSFLGANPQTMLSSLPLRSGTSIDASVAPKLSTTARKPFLFVRTNCSSDLPSTSAWSVSPMTSAEEFISASLLEVFGRGTAISVGGGAGDDAGFCSQPDPQTVSR